MRSAETVRPEQAPRRSTFGVRVRARTTSGDVALALRDPQPVVGQSADLRLTRRNPRSGPRLGAAAGGAARLWRWEHGWVRSRGQVVRPALDEDLPFLRRMLYEAANRPGTPWPAFDVSMEEARNRRFWSGWMREGDIGVVAEDNTRSLSVRRGYGGSPVRNCHPSTTRTSRFLPSGWNGTTEVAASVVFSWMP